MLPSRAIRFGAFCLVALGLAAEAGAFRWERVPAVRNAIRVFPSMADPGTVFVWTRAGLVVSKDGGSSFAERCKADALGSVTDLLVSPVRPAMLYAGTDEGGVFASQDEGATWRSLGGTDKGLAHPHIHSLVFSREDPTFTTLFATHSTRHPGISMTFDGGETWRRFAMDYGAGDLILLGTHIFFAGAHPAGGGETGFYRSIDAGKNWFRVLNVENPTVLVAGKVGARRAWCGTATGGLYVTDNFGVSTRGVGPQTGINVASIAVGFKSPTEEVAYLYDPTGEGVLASTDGFATWQKLNDGLYVGDWVASGAMMAANADGSALYACVNGSLYRGTRAAGPVGLTALRAEPAAVVAGEGAATVTCRAAKGSEIRIDLSPVGGAPSVEMLDDGKNGDGAAGDGVYGVRFEVPEKALTPPKDYQGPPLPGQVALAVKAARGQDVEAGHGVLTVVANPRDRVLWDGEDENGFSTWNHDGVSIRRSQEQPLSGGTHLRVQFSRGRDAPPTGGFSWKNPGGWWDGDDTRAYKLFCFSIRSDKAGPTDLKLALRDDGRKYGHGDGGRSNDLPLARYLPEVTTKYQLVAIPMADFIFGSAALPEAICELVFVSPAGEPRLYDLDDIGLGVQPGPRLSAGRAVLLPDGRSVRLSVRVGSVAGRLGAVAAQANGRTIPLVGGASLPRVTDVAEDIQAASLCYAATVPAADLGAGLRTLRFTAQDAAGTRDMPVSVFLPRRPPGHIALAGGPVKCDGDLAEFEDAEPFVLSEGPLSLRARILHGEGRLHFALEVKDPGFVLRKVEPKPEALATGPSVEVLITSPTAATAMPRDWPSPEDHRIVFAMREKGAWAALRTHHWDAAGVPTNGGYAIEAQVPFDALRAENRGCDFAVGRSTRIEIRLNGANGARLVWAAASAKDSENPDHWGLATFTREAGPPRIRYERCDGRTLKLVSNKPLDEALARSVSSYEIPGTRLAAAEVAGEGRIVRLTAAEPWKVGGRVSLKFRGLKSADGLAPRGDLDFTVLPGRTLGGEPFQEFLIGEVRRGVPMQAAWQREYVAGGVRPAAGGQWKLAASDDGLFRLLDLVGRFDNSVAHAHAYLFSDADRTVQLWIGSDDGLRVTLNGETIYTNTTARGADSQKIKGVRLKKGWNSLLLGISQGGGDWNFSARLMGGNGEEPQGVSYTAESPFGPAAR